MRLKKVLVIVLAALALTPMTRANAALYSFTSIKLTPCGAAGRLGPTLANCTSAYAAQSWTANTSYFNVSNGIQSWTVPLSGNYNFVVAGAQGGGSSNSTKAAVETATLTLNQGDVISILVGQAGTIGGSSTVTGSGGGGTFVVKGTTPLIVAGGSGGQGDSAQGTSASLTTSGSSGASSGGGAGGTGGNGGSGAAFTGGGGGFTGDGANETNSYATNSNAGLSFLNGGYGGYGGQGGGWTPGSDNGGFGGGAGTCACNTGGGGGAGGYSGGGGGGNSGGYGGGGGGGSYVIGTATITSSAIANTGNGYVAISLSGVAPTTPTIGLVGGGTRANYRTTTQLQGTFNTDVKAVFYQNGKRIPGCQSVQTVSSVATCAWKPSALGVADLFVTGSNSMGSAKSADLMIAVVPRTGVR